jgi:hypothetical protein
LPALRNPAAEFGFWRNQGPTSEPAALLLIHTYLLEFNGFAKIFCSLTGIFCERDVDQAYLGFL